jgi:cytochrome d ubiquinol oxidase subunit I
MSDLLFARSQMALSLMFHIIFAAIGIGLPVLMVIAEAMYLRTHRPVYLELAKRWARGSAILFAVGAVSGTVLSFELGLLWPSFMAKAGGIIGMPFSLEGFAFFTEAIFLGVFLFGWNKLPPLLHWLSGVLVAVGGISSGIFVVTANAWMNAPTGFKIVGGKMTDVDPIAAMLNPASMHEVLHMTLAALIATGFAVAAVHAFLLLHDRRNQFHRTALGLALILACVCTPIQIWSGDLSARTVARIQPAKLAALEANYRTQTGAPILLGGIPDDDARTVKYAIPIPHGLSFLSTHDFNAKIIGLEEFPRKDWPNVRFVHWFFQLMVACGLALLALSIYAGWFWWKHHRLADSTWFLSGVVAAGPLSFVAIELGWFVTELGRQPWIVYGVMRTAEAVTPMRWLVVPFVIFTIVYLFLAFMVVYLLCREFLKTAPAELQRTAS